jgi:hypothetical protein
MKKGNHVMDIIGISVLFLIIFFISLLWRYLLNDMLKSEKGSKVGNKSVPTAFEFETQEYEYKKELLETVKKAPPSNRSSFMLTTEPVIKKIFLEKNKQTTIERELQLQYKRSIYVNKAFSLRITIAGKDKIISKDGKEIDRIRIDKLNFKAYEKEPKVTVELKFAEGDFKVNHPKKTQKLKESEDTVFDFMVSPLKAEDCILTVVFSYTDKIPTPEKTTEKVVINKTTTPEKGNKTTEYTEQTTTVPVQIVEKEIEIKSIDLIISVKSLLGLDAKQLDLVKKSVPAAVALIIFAYQIMSGELEGTDAIITAIPAVLAAFGVEGADKLLGNKKEEDSEEGT